MAALLLPRPNLLRDGRPSSPLAGSMASRLPFSSSQIHDAVAVAAATAAGSLFPLSFSSPAWWAADPVLWVVDLVLWGLGMVVALRNFD